MGQSPGAAGGGNGCRGTVHIRKAEPWEHPLGRGQQGRGRIMDSVRSVYTVEADPWEQKPPGGRRPQRVSVHGREGNSGTSYLRHAAHNKGKPGSAWLASMKQSAATQCTAPCSQCSSPCGSLCTPRTLASRVHAHFAKYMQNCICFAALPRVLPTSISGRQRYLERSFFALRP